MSFFLHQFTSLVPCTRIQEEKMSIHQHCSVSSRKPLDYLQRASQQLRTLFVPLSVKVIYIKTNHPNVKN